MYISVLEGDGTMSKNSAENLKKRKRVAATFSDATLDAQIRSRNWCREITQRPGTRHEVVVGVFSVNASLESMTVNTQLILTYWQVLAGRHLNHQSLSNNIITTNYPKLAGEPALELSEILSK